MMRNLLLPASLLAALFTSRPALAQLHGLRLDAGLGMPLHTLPGHASSTNLELHLGASVRLSDAYGLALDLRDGGDVGSTRATSTCVMSIGGCIIGCADDPRPLDISGAALSVERSWGATTRSIRPRLSLGIGGYNVSRLNDVVAGTSAFGIQGGAYVANVESHLGLTIGIQPTFLPNLRGARAWYVPIGVGIMVQ